MRAMIANRNAHAITNVSITLKGSGLGGDGCTASVDQAPARLEDLGGTGGYGSRCRIDSIAAREVVVVQWHGCDNFLSFAGTFTNVLTVSVAPDQFADRVTTVSAVTRMFPDSDDDGMLDEWETANGLDPASRSDADLDRDADGLVNRDEYQAGTNPSDSVSRPELISVVRITAGTTPGWRLVLRTVSGRFYRLERTERLTEPRRTPWTVVAEEIRGTGGAVAVTDPDTTSPGPRFYRAIVLP